MLRSWGVKYGVEDLGQNWRSCSPAVRIWGLGLRVQGSGFRVLGSGFGVNGSGLRFEG